MKRIFILLFLLSFSCLYAQHAILGNVNPNIRTAQISDIQTTDPYLLQFFDIECSSENSKFPIPEKDPIIVISNILFEFNEKEKKIVNQSIFSFYKCANISNVDIYSFDNEVDLLNQWRNFIIKLDPDIITGFNINSFDFPYLIKRSEYLKIKNFSLFSRIKNSYSYLINIQKLILVFLKKKLLNVKLQEE